MENSTSGLKVIIPRQETWRALQQQLVSSFIGI
jgi:hypothetical protein